MFCFCPPYKRLGPPALHPPVDRYWTIPMTGPADECINYCPRLPWPGTVIPTSNYCIFLTSTRQVLRSHSTRIKLLLHSKLSIHLCYTFSVFGSSHMLVPTENPTHYFMYLSGTLTLNDHRRFENSRGCVIQMLWRVSRWRQITLTYENPRPPRALVDQRDLASPENPSELSNPSNF